MKQSSANDAIAAHSHAKRTRCIAKLSAVVAAVVVFAGAPRIASAENDPCAGKTPGTITFYASEIDREKPLPPPVTQFELGKPMYALACLTDAVGPQEQGGKKFRVVLYVKQVNLPEGKYSSYAQAKQEGGVFRPELSKSRKNIIIYLHEDFTLDSLEHKLDPGEYEFRLQAASEKGTGKLDLTVQVNQDNVTGYVQELRKAGYLADGKVKVIRK